MIARRTFALVGGTVAGAAAVVAGVHTGSPVEGVKALIAGLIAVATAGLALSLRGITLRGIAIGGFFALAGILTWTATSHPLIIWAVLAVEGVVCAIWAWPWLASVRTLPRLGTAWLGLAYWIFGVIGAGLVGHAGVGLQRVAYAGVFSLAAMAVVAGVRRSGVDLSVGIVAAFLLATAALLLAGSGNLFDSVHAIPNHDAATVIMRYRFWGGPGFFYHPNSFAGLVMVAAIRIGPDRTFAAWQRLAATVLAGFVLYETNSRIAFVLGAAAAVLHAAVLLWPRIRTAGLPSYRRPWAAAATPFAVLALVLLLSGGQGFLFQSRFGPDDVTSGRIDTWKQVGRDWEHAGWAEKTFGDARTSRAVVERVNTTAPPGSPKLKLNTDNAAVGALRHGGVLGAIAFVLGLVLLVRRAVIRRVVSRRTSGVPPAAWFTIAAIAALPTIATEDWLLGGTNGGIWLLLLAGEVYHAVAGTPDAGAPEPVEAGAQPAA